LDIRAVDIHPVDPVAWMSVAFRLKYQLLSIERKICLGIFAAECELFYVCKMLFARNLQCILGVKVDTKGYNDEDVQTTSFHKYK
jgi:hypothetical protein